MDDLPQGPRRRSPLEGSLRRRSLSPHGLASSPYAPREGNVNGRSRGRGRFSDAPAGPFRDSPREFEPASDRTWKPADSAATRDRGPLSFARDGPASQARDTPPARDTSPHTRPRQQGPTYAERRWHANDEPAPEISNASSTLSTSALPYPILPPSYVLGCTAGAVQHILLGVRLLVPT